MIEQGMKAPDFTLEDKDGNQGNKAGINKGGARTRYQDVVGDEGVLGQDDFS